jgi:hypothetical protein
MKTLFILPLLLILSSCQEKSDIEIIKEVEPTLTEETIKKTIGSQSEQYGSEDLLDFLSVYGENVTDITPAFMNYYQDISSSQSNSLYDNLTEPNGNYSYRWFINEKLVSTDYNLVLNPLVNVLPCEGVMRVKLEVTDNRFKSVYVREEYGFLEFVDKDDFTEWCECGGCPDYWDVFYEFYPPRDPYFYQTKPARWDFDKNNFINSEDLLIFLSKYGEQ